MRSKARNDTTYEFVNSLLNDPYPVMYDLLEERVSEVHLAHPLKVKAIAEAKIKNDKIDSKVLADLLRADLIPEAYAPSKETRYKKGLLRYRAALVGLQTSIKNRIHGVLGRNHVSMEEQDAIHGHHAARIAVARKLARSAYHILKTGKPFQEELIREQK